MTDMIFKTDGEEKFRIPSNKLEIPDSGYLKSPGTVCPKTPLHIREMTSKETIQQLKEDIAILQEKLKKLEELETHTMTYVNEGKVEIVSYNDMTYYRLDLPDDVYWYISKRDVDDAILLKQVTYGETHRLLEGLWFNQIKKGRYKEDDVFEKPKPKTLNDVLKQLDKPMFVDDVLNAVDSTEVYEMYKIGWNEAIQTIKEKLR